MCRIGIIEDYSLFSSGIRPVFNDIKEFTVAGISRDVDSFVHDFTRDQFDVIIYDLIHCKTDPLKMFKKLRRRYRNVPVLLIVDEDLTPCFEELIAMGAEGIIFNSVSLADLILSVRMLKSGEDYIHIGVWNSLKVYLRNFGKKKVPEENKSPLSTRELAVLDGFCKGATYKEIGDQLNISPRTVETHKKNILVKLNLNSKAEMIKYGLSNGHI